MNSYSFDSLKQEQVYTGFKLYLKEKSSLLEKLLTNGERQTKGTNPKYEWLEAALTPQSCTIDGAISAGTLSTTTPANLTFDSTTGLAVGTIIRFVGETTLSPVGNLQVKISAITSGTVVTGVIYGGSTDVTIPDNSVAKLVARPRAENEKSFTGDNDYLPSKEYNYFQIFRETVELSRTALETMTFGDTNSMVQQMAQAYYKVEQQMAEELYYGLRVERSSTQNGTFAGLDFFLNQSGGNIVDASSADITLTMINNAGEMIMRDGGTTNAILCNPTQARKISALNTVGNNPVVMQNSTDVGSFVMRVISDIPTPGGIINTIIVDEKVPNNKVYLINTNLVALVPYGNSGALAVEDATVKGQDGVTGVLRGEYTARIQDAKTSAACIKNLKIS